MRFVIGVDACEIAGGAIELRLLERFAFNDFEVVPMLDMTTQVRNLRNISERAATFLNRLHKGYRAEFYMGIAAGFVPPGPSSTTLVRIDMGTVAGPNGRIYRTCCFNKQHYQYQAKHGLFSLLHSAETVETAVQFVSRRFIPQLPKPTS